MIEFLSRDPSEVTSRSLRDTIRDYQRVHGVSQKIFAEQIGIDPSGVEKRRTSALEETC